MGPRAGEDTMTSENDALIERVAADPEFQRLVRERTGLAWTLTGIMAVIYLGFILLVAFAPKFLGAPLADGVTTIGIPLGIGVILAAFVLTGFYVMRANSRYDAMVQRIVERAKA